MTNEELFIMGNYEQLYIQNKGLIYMYAHKYNNIETFEERVSICNVGFCKCLKNYNPEKSKFTTYLGYYLIGELNKYVRDSKWYKLNLISLDEVIYNSSNSNNEITINDKLKDDFNLEETVINNIQLEKLKKCINKLPERQRKVIELNLNNKTQHEISEVVNVSQVQVSRILKSTYKDLKKLMEKENVIKKQNLIKEKGECKMEKTNKQLCYELFEQGIDNITIANKLKLSIRTVETYKSHYNRNNKMAVNKITTNTNIKTEINNADNKHDITIKPNIEIKQPNIYKENNNGKSKFNLLKPILFQGNTMNYELSQDSIIIKNDEYSLHINKSQLESFIDELIELKNVLK